MYLLLLLFIIIIIVILIFIAFFIPRYAVLRIIFVIELFVELISIHGMHSRQ